MSRLTALLLLTVAALLLSGCGALGIDAPKTSSATGEACARFVATLPEHVADQPRRTVDAPRQGAAWGDPAIVVRCGVGTPPGFTRAATCFLVNGVGWYIPQTQLDSSPAEFTIFTIGRSPRVEATVPKTYLPPATVLADLARPVRTGTRTTSACRP